MKSGEYLPYEYGRCDREDNCGYYRYPETKPDHIHTRGGGVPDSIPRSVAIRTIKNGLALKNDFARGLMRVFSLDQVIQVLNKYGTGTAKGGKVIFFQYDLNGDIRTGKAMKYDPITLKRDKSSPPYFVHKSIKPDYNLRQTFFGMHLAKKRDPDNTLIMIVESEKTAILCDLMKTNPDEIYMATGGSNNLKDEPLNILSKFHIILIPDIGKAQKWSSKVEIRKRVKIWKFEKDEFDLTYPDKLYQPGNDVGDFLLESRRLVQVASDLNTK